MRRWWRPFITHAVILSSFCVAGFGFSRDTLLTALAIQPAVVVFIAVMAPSIAHAGLRSFLKGLEEGGEPLEVADKEVGWLGGVTMSARNARGEWRLRAVGLTRQSVYVTFPGQADEVRYSGWERRAGLQAAKDAAVLAREDRAPDS